MSYKVFAAHRSTSFGIALILTVAASLALPFELHAQDGSWHLVANLKNALISDVECRSNGVCAMVSNVVAESVIWISTDAGRTWEDVYRRDFVRDTAAVGFAMLQFVGDSTIIVGTHKGKIAISKDLGRTFQYRTVTDTAFTRWLQMDDRGRGTVIFGWHPLYRVFATQDTGRTWSRVQLPDSIRFADTIRALPSMRVAATSASWIGSERIAVLLASDPDDVLLTTTDLGASWTISREDNETIPWMKFVDSTYGFLYGGGAVYVVPGDRKPSMYRTTNGGVTWQRSLVGARIRDIATRDGRRIIAVGELDKVYTSLDSGQTWELDSFPVRGPVVSWCELADTGRGIIVGAYGDLFRKDAIGLVRSAREARRLASVSLAGESIVVVHPETARRVSLALYDLNGRLVEVLATTRLSSIQSAVVFQRAGRAHPHYLAVAMIDGNTASAATFIRR
ncbi:MAG TPA: hypothetical protein VNA88_08565 [Candidatus Kapabacteria bacterium]|jgi:photosystem II stability/assembly factor-like uncharacterized protein|nr:hypothetical protein [Candidatus Kapabacteria bacterium]